MKKSTVPQWGLYNSIGCDPKDREVSLTFLRFIKLTSKHFGLTADFNLECPRLGIAHVVVGSPALDSLTVQISAKLAIQWKLLIGLTFVLEEVNPKSDPTL